MFIFFFNDTATTEIYTLSLHDALPIFPNIAIRNVDLLGSNPLFGLNAVGGALALRMKTGFDAQEDRKSTRLNSSHANISYAVFCLKKKKITHTVNIISIYT